VLRRQTDLRKRMANVVEAYNVAVEGFEARTKAVAEKTKMITARCGFASIVNCCRHRACRKHQGDQHSRATCTRIQHALVFILARFCLQGEELVRRAHGPQGPPGALSLLVEWLHHVLA